MALKGAQVFGLSGLGSGSRGGIGSRGSENIVVTGSQRIGGSGEGSKGEKTAMGVLVQARNVVKPSQFKNRKKKAVELEDTEEARPQKRHAFGDLNNLVSIPVKAARQPHQSL